MGLTKLQTYDSAVIPRLVSTLRALFALNRRLRALVSATIRNEQTFETFLDACSGSLGSGGGGVLAACGHWMECG